MRQAKAKFVVGLTATPTRKDGHHPIICMQCGPARFTMAVRAMTESTPFDHTVIPRATNFRIPGEPTIQDIYSAMTTDQARNRSTAEDVARAVEQGRSPLVLTGRTEHLAQLQAALGDRVGNIVVRKGGMGRKQRLEVNERLAAIPESEPRLILATGSYIGEGFDDARLDTLFLAMPISWKGTLQQYVGRLHRLHDGKKVVEVYDYVDADVVMLARMYGRRLKGYADMGYKNCRGGAEEARSLKFQILMRSSTGNAENISGSNRFGVLLQGDLPVACAHSVRTAPNSHTKTENALRWRASESLQLPDLIGADERT